MFDAIINDPTIFEVTIVVILLVCVAIWQKLKQFSAILGGIYLLYLFFIIFSYEPTEKIIVKEDYQEEIVEVEESNDIKNEIVDVDTSSEKVNIVKTPKKTEPVQEITQKPAEPILNPLPIIDDPIKVLNISFGTDVIDRKLEGKSSSFSTESDRIYCLSGIQNRRDDTKLYHKWYHEGDLKSKVLLDVGKSFNWRTWSYINVYENRVGEWLLVIEDTLGVRHDSLTFIITSSN